MPHGAIDVDGVTTGPTHQVMVVVPNPMLVAGRRPGGLDAPEQTPIDEHSECVVDPLTGDRAQLGPDRLGHLVGGAVRGLGHGAKDCQALRRHLKSAITKKGRRSDVRRQGHVNHHLVDSGLCQNLEPTQIRGARGRSLRIQMS